MAGYEVARGRADGEMFSTLFLLLIIWAQNCQSAQATGCSLAVAGEFYPPPFQVKKLAEGEFELAVPRDGAPPVLSQRLVLISSVKS